MLLWLSWNSAKKRKEYLVLTCGPPSVSPTVPSGKAGEDSESCSDDDSDGDEEIQTVMPPCVLPNLFPICVFHLLIAQTSFFVAGLYIWPAQTKEEAENHQEREGEGMGFEEERADEEKGKCGAS